MTGDGGDVTDYTVLSGSSIEKGTLMMLSGAGTRTAFATRVTPRGITRAHAFAGITSSEKTDGSDDSINIGCYTNGFFMIRAGVTCAAGDLVMLSGANSVRPVTVTDVPAALFSGSIVGRAMEAITADTQGEVKIGTITS